MLARTLLGLCLAAATAEEDAAFHVTLSYTALVFHGDLDLQEASAISLRLDHQVSRELRIGVSYLLADTEVDMSGRPDSDTEFEQWTVWVAFVQPLEAYPHWYLNVSAGLGLTTFDARHPVNDDHTLAAAGEAALVYRVSGGMYATFGMLILLIPTDFVDDQTTLTINGGLFFGLGYSL